MRELNNYDSEDVCHIVRILTTFQYYQHFCLAFELLQAKPLSISFLLDSYPINNCEPKQPIPPRVGQRVVARQKLSMIRKLAFQLMLSLLFLQEHDLIHADLKPDNILFRNGIYFESILYFNIYM